MSGRRDCALIDVNVLKRCALSISIDADLRKPGESQDPRRRGRHVDHSTAHEGATIVDGHDHRTSITLIRDLHL